MPPFRIKFIVFEMFGRNLPLNIRFALLKSKLIICFESCFVNRFVTHCVNLFTIKMQVKQNTHFIFRFTHIRITYYFIFFKSSNQIVAHASLGILRSPRGETATVPTFGPSGRHERLNCCEKKRL